MNYIYFSFHNRYISYKTCPIILVEKNTIYPLSYAIFRMANLWDNFYKKNMHPIFRLSAYYNIALLFNIILCFIFGKKIRFDSLQYFIRIYIQQIFYFIICRLL
nr:MAG TPA: hypothetical protein [Caudoviricetes sp.]